MYVKRLESSNPPPETKSNLSHDWAQTLPPPRADAVIGPDAVGIVNTWHAIIDVIHSNNKDTKSCEWTHHLHTSRELHVRFE